MTSASFIVSIINDDTRENNEDFILIIDYLSLIIYYSSPVPVGDPDQATVNILDDDGM